VAKTDSFVLLPTGGGKSLCYQIPALLLDGSCLVVSPLIALMHDQVSRLKSMGISATYFHSAQSRSEIAVELESLRNGKYKLAYISPERIDSDLFKSYLPSLNISFIAIDEAHCVSQWGHDFRPSYLDIKSLREIKPELTFLALTASATPRVQEDIIAQLEMKDTVVFQSTFNRPNLVYRLSHSQSKREHILSICRQTSGSGIVYAPSRAKSMELSSWLNQEGISCEYYHAGLSAEERKRRQEAWIESKVPVIVCTNAFGMGIDKPNVRFVVHYSPPNSLESYYQEAGRAGRDGKKAIGLLLYDENDLKRDRLNLETQFPTIKQLQGVYEAICNFLQLAINSGKGSTFAFDLKLFCDAFNFRPVEVHYAVKRLQSLKYLSLIEGQQLSSVVKVEMNSTGIYDFQLKHSRFEPLIKFLLRSYGGIYERFVAISEKRLSAKLNLPLKQVLNQLTELNKIGILSYKPGTDKPIIFFDSERVGTVVDESNRLKSLREEALHRLNSVHSYIEEEVCRPVQLCHYFGEELKKTCENCDVCLARRRNSFSTASFSKAFEAIRHHLQNNRLNHMELLSKFSDNEEDVRLAIRWMLEDGTIGIDENRKLWWRK